MANINQLNHFQVLNKLDAKIKSNIKLICVFGKDGKEVIVVTNDDHVHAYGSNTEGCLGLTPLNKRVTTPTFVPDLSNKGIVELSYGSSHMIARTQNDELLTWGSNEYGQLGNGTLTSSSKPLTLPEFSRSKVTSIACGLLHSMVLTDTGDVYCWGFNQNGQIGNYAKGNQPTPAKLDKFNRDPIVAIAAGAAHSIALDKRGHLYSWGYNRFGQLGSGNTTAQNTPAPVYDLLNFRAQKVICGAYHSLVLSTEGALYSFGSNEFKQLGKDVKHSNIPTEIVIKHANGTKKPVKDIVASVYCNISMAQTQDDVCYQWGKCGAELRSTTKETGLSSFHECFARNADSNVNFVPLCLNPTECVNRKVSVIDTLSDSENLSSLFKVEKSCLNKSKSERGLIKINSFSAVNRIFKKNIKENFNRCVNFLNKSNPLSNDVNDENEELDEQLCQNYNKTQKVSEKSCRDLTPLEGMFTQTGRYTREFEEIAQIGVGSIALVFKARNMIDKRMYAIKKIGVYDESDTRATTKELRIWAHLDTKYVVEYKSSWVETNTSKIGYTEVKMQTESSPTVSKIETPMQRLVDGKAILYIQMELCNRTLLDVIKNELIKVKPDLMTDCDVLSETGYYIASQLFAQILDCIDYLQKQNIIHRDLKPGNILITNDTNVKIADFGLVIHHYFEQSSNCQAIDFEI